MMQAVEAVGVREVNNEEYLLLHEALWIECRPEAVGSQDRS